MKNKIEPSGSVNVPFMTQFLVDVEATSFDEARAKSTQTNQRGSPDWDHD
ncbi:hypothetical protein HN803_01115 [candidate division WWE3 bacterium]|nr:hypothetical protein [candidate division WWE3 bacterium]MBT7349373.1 hypothetical protein [candidate division WWE3 bacterium]